MSLILLVEDVEDNRELARMLLEVGGHDVIEAHTGTEAIAQAKTHRPALILTATLRGATAVVRVRDVS